MEQDIKFVGIIGGGKMGKSLFNHLIKYPFEIVWFNRSNAYYEQRKFLKKNERERQLLITSDEEVQQKIDRVRITDNFENLSLCSLIIETISEDLNNKNILFKSLENIINKDAIIVSNSSSIIPDRFSIPNSFKDRFAGLHFFFPVETTNITEIILSSHFNEGYVNTLKSFITSIEKQFILQNTNTAFAANRYFLEIQSTFFNYCVANNIPFDVADNVIREELFPMGIFMLMDYIGFDTLIYAINNYMYLHENPEQIKPLLLFLTENSAKGIMGVKTGKGFHTYPSVEVSTTLEFRSQIISYVRNIFNKFAMEYRDKKLFTKEELMAVTAVFTHQEFNPYS
ncbi:MAG: 3-hydroxyacyl-CoA dehydrogenase NAD-binding domain-containing protein [Bacteroidales bacterium]|nr:3-hydroxyacyl-CoA dehydrogenase NAD-binding domain-containing protein [Bacteroidales bacterium]